jgi:hypothetical protein
MPWAAFAIVTALVLGIVATFAIYTFGWAIKTESAARRSAHALPSAYARPRLALEKLIGVAVTGSEVELYVIGSLRPAEVLEPVQAEVHK